MTMTVFDVERWLRAYGAAWESRSAEATRDLFTDDALYFETPFEDALRGLEGVGAYWEQATSGQRDIRFGAEVLCVAGDRALAHWSARFSRRSSGAQVELDGIFLLRFVSDGRCRELREWWHAQERPGVQE